jgi:hypothetical protein
VVHAATPSRGTECGMGSTLAALGPVRSVPQRDNEQKSFQ